MRTLSHAVIGHEVEDDAKPAGVGLADQTPEVLRRPVLGPHRPEVPDRVGAAEGALAVLFADGLERHQPENGDPEVAHVVESGGDSVQVTGWREGAREDLIENAVPGPGGSLPCARTSREGLRLGVGRNGEGGHEKEPGNGADPHGPGC
jgi:hypothetical protein